jgi:hypothetical protein
MFSIREVVRVLNMRDEQAAFNLLAAYARQNGATYISASGVWFEPAMSASTQFTPPTREEIAEIRARIEAHQAGQEPSNAHTTEEA